MIVRYDSAKNPGLRPDGTGTPDAIPGVPLRDMDIGDLAALPAYLLASIAAAAFYVIVDPADWAELVPADPPAAAPALPEE